MTTEQELRLAAKALENIDQEPRYVYIDGEYRKAPSRIWQRYLRAYRNWLQEMCRG